MGGHASGFRGPREDMGLVRREDVSCHLSLAPLKEKAEKEYTFTNGCDCRLPSTSTQNVMSHRYITKNLQKEFGFHGMQVRLTLKKSVNVYDPEGRGGSGKGRPKRKFGKKGRLLPLPPSPTRYRPGSHK